MNSEMLEGSLRDMLSGDESLTPGRRMQTIAMLHGLAKPQKGGWNIHVNPDCLQIVLGDAKQCSCGRDGEIQFFKIGCNGETSAEVLQRTSIKWTMEDLRAKRAESKSVTA